MFSSLVRDRTETSIPLTEYQQEVLATAHEGALSDLIQMFGPELGALAVSSVSSSRCTSGQIPSDEDRPELFPQEEDIMASNMTRARQTDQELQEIETPGGQASMPASLQPLQKTTFQLPSGTQHDHMSQEMTREPVTGSWSSNAQFGEASVPQDGPPPDAWMRFMTNPGNASSHQAVPNLDAPAIPRHSTTSTYDPLVDNHRTTTSQVYDQIQGTMNSTPFENSYSTYRPETNLLPPLESYQPCRCGHGPHFCNCLQRQ